MVQRQRAHRRDMDAAQARRRDEEQRQRAARIPKGLKGVWSWATGQTRKIRLQNEAEALRAAERDRAEREAIVQKQLAERRVLQQRVKLVRGKQHEVVQDLTREAAHYARLGRNGPEPARETKPDAPKRDRGGQSRNDGHGMEPD